MNDLQRCLAEKWTSIHTGIDEEKIKRIAVCLRTQLGVDTLITHNEPSRKVFTLHRENDIPLLTVARVEAYVQGYGQGQVDDC